MLFFEVEMIIELNKHQVEEMLYLASQLTAHPSEFAELFCNQAKELSKRVPMEVRTQIQEFAAKGSDKGFLLIKGIPIDDDALPMTPPGNIYRQGESTQLARVQAILVYCCDAEMIAYEAEGYGRLFQDVVPIQAMAAQKTSVGSSIELEIHTEQAFSRVRPDILSLACLRGDKTAFTHIFPVQYILDECTPTERELLREPLWMTSVDLSFKMNKNYEFIDGEVRGPLPIISGTDADPTLVFDQDLMTGTTPESQAMVNKIVDIYYKRYIAHNLTAGEIILVDNRRAVHGRSPFFPIYDGKDRFLVRCFGCFDYAARTEYARPKNGRIVAAIFS